MIKESYLGSINTNKNKNSINNNENLNYPKKANSGSPYDVKTHDNIIKTLKSKIQRQEIDLKFLNEKLKKLQTENAPYQSESSSNYKKESKLNVK